MSSLAVTDEVLLAYAADVAAEGPVTVAGGRTRWTVGGEVHPGARVLCAPVGIVDYRPEEMVVTVRAGTSVAELDEALSHLGQRCALPSRGGTVGGAVAVGENDLGVLGRGSVRNAVLQVRYVASDGQMVTGGGPVVKNVSGFNLPKLMTGALGTLGLLAEVVLRTNPLPERSSWLVAPDADPLETYAVLLRPGAILWDGTSTWVLLEGHPGDVDADAARLGALGSFGPCEGPPPLPPHRLRSSPAEVARLQTEVVGSFVASIGVGTAWTSLPVGDRAPDPVALDIADRMKQLFDPTGRLNPGRTPGA